MLRYFQLLFLFFVFLSCSKKEEVRILVFSKTTGFRHESIREGQLALINLGKENNFIVDTTEDVTKFIEPVLKQYSAIVFLQPTGDLFNQKQKSEFKRYIQAGGGFVGIHAAADAEHDWTWYKKLLGAEFASHPAVQKAKLHIVDRSHLSTKKLPDVWERSDEWYNFKNLNPAVRVLIDIDEKTYKGGTMGENHPMAWYHEFDAGHSFYTELGHTKESFKEPLLLNHILGGIKYAIGENKRNYALSSPEEDRFIRTVLAEKLNEPMKLGISAAGQIFFIQRTGAILEYIPSSGKINKIGELHVSETNEDGLLGMALDPNFTHNNWIYFFYSPFGEIPQQYISRFTLVNGKVDLTSEKIILKIPTQRNYCCHSGGSLAFDKHGNLFISVGDNTSPSRYAAIDERPGFSHLDAQTTAANTNDLRGKILRIHPEDDGSYSIPEGNLFPPGTQKTRPEIYAMGLRNPFRISIDPRTSDLFWGDVGPDAGVDSTFGPKGHDEINIATKPGFFGWPYFVGDNKPYQDYDFATKKFGNKFNPSSPSNNSPNNTGLLNLPPAQKALVWYPSDDSKDFEDVGNGGRTAMAGPFYYYNNFKKIKDKFPKYYNGRVLFYDWMRGWVKAVRLDENKKIIKSDKIFTNMNFEHPIDMAFAPDGSMYLLEYGTRWHSPNDNARLLRINYEWGNRPPIAVIDANDTVGPLPLKVKFSGNKSFDLDMYDQLIYEWRFDDKKIQSREKEPVFEFKKPGIYSASLTVTDQKGMSNTTYKEIVAGNHFPVISWEVLSNKTFYWPGIPVKYKVNVSDEEDKVIDKNEIKVNAIYSANTEVPGLNKKTDKEEIDQPLINASDCKACHTLNERSVGPSFMEVCRKYKNDKSAIDKIADKIINGGGGVWGVHLMSSHPQIPKNNAREMVKYILALEKPASVKIALKPEGEFIPEIEPAPKGKYNLVASYTDKGAPGMKGFEGKGFYLLKSPKVEASDYDFNKGTTGRFNDKDKTYFYEGGQNKSLLAYTGVDLTGVNEITITANSKVSKGKVEIRIDSLRGTLIGTCPINPTGAWEDWKETSSKVLASPGIHDIYFIYFAEPDQWMNVRYVHFKR